MTHVHVQCHLAYDVQASSGFLLAVAAAETPHQRIVEQRLELSPQLTVERLRFDPHGHDLVRIAAEVGPLELSYDAVVEVVPRVAPDAPRREVPFLEVPGDVLTYLHPSRYCQSDVLGRFAQRTFGGLEPGFERVTGICNWIWEHLTYTAGSTDASTTAVDVLVGAVGVCRDYAHLGIAFARALGIPARYVSGYAVDLVPPDFHGFFEAYLDGDWYLFDATRMAPVDGLVRIAAGRDAADVAFAAIVGRATLVDKQVVVIDLDRNGPPDPAATPALGTA
jgi:transglutaminase-like putative cysteine protease